MLKKSEKPLSLFLYIYLWKRLAFSLEWTSAEVINSKSGDDKDDGWKGRRLICHRLMK